VVFAEPDRTSPRRVSGGWPLSAAAQAELDRLPDNDAVFAEAIARHGVVLGFAARGEAGPEPAARAVDAPYRYVWMGEPDTGILAPLGSAVRPLAALGAAASGIGALSFVP